MSKEQINAYVQSLGEYVALLARAKLDAHSVKDAFKRRMAILRAFNSLPARLQVDASRQAQTDVWSVDYSQAAKEQILSNERAVEKYIQKFELWDAVL